MSTVVVDTNVVAYFLLNTEPFAGEARAFWSLAIGPRAPASWEAEIVNVLWMATRAGVIDVAEAQTKLRLARRLGIESVSVAELWEGALSRAASSGHPAYDTLFVELAARLGCPLATFDEGLLAKFPGIARRPVDVTLASTRGARSPRRPRKNR